MHSNGTLCRKRFTVCLCTNGEEVETGLISRALLPWELNISQKASHNPRSHSTFVSCGYAQNMNGNAPLRLRPDAACFGIFITIIKQSHVIHTTNSIFYNDNNLVIGVSLSEPHISGTALRMCVCMFACLLYCKI